MFIKFSNNWLILDNLFIFWKHPILKFRNSSIQIIYNFTVSIFRIIATSCRFQIKQLCNLLVFLFQQGSIRLDLSLKLLILILSRILFVTAITTCRWNSLSHPGSWSTSFSFLLLWLCTHFSKYFTIGLSVRSHLLLLFVYYSVFSISCSTAMFRCFKYFLKFRNRIWNSKRRYNSSSIMITVSERIIKKTYRTLRLLCLL